MDVILAGDLWYEQGSAERSPRGWNVRARRGTDVLIGDPGRRYLDPATAFTKLADYEVRSTTDLEDLGRTRAWVYELENER